IAVIDQPRLKANVRLATHYMRGEKAAENLAQMLLGYGGTGSTGRGACDRDKLAGPGIIAIGPRPPVDRVLKNRRNGAIVLWGHEKHRSRPLDFALEPLNTGGKGALMVLVEDWQVIDLHYVRRELAIPELCECLGQLAVDRLTAIAAHDNRNIDLS